MFLLSCLLMTDTVLSVPIVPLDLPVLIRAQVRLFGSEMIYGGFMGCRFPKRKTVYFVASKARAHCELIPKQGQQSETFRGINFISASPFDDAVLFGNHNNFTLHSGKSEKLWSVPRESFAVMDVAWSPENLAISECADAARKAPGAHAGVRCFSFHGELLWRHKGRWTHIFSLMYRPESRQFIGFDPDRGKEIYLQFLDEQTGRVARELLLPHMMCGEFCKQG